MTKTLKKIMKLITCKTYYKANVKRLNQIGDTDNMAHRHLTALWRLRHLYCMLIPVVMYTCVAVPMKWSFIKIGRWSIALILHEKWVISCGTVGQPMQSIRPTIEKQLSMHYISHPWYWSYDICLKSSKTVFNGYLYIYSIYSYNKHVQS